MKEPFQIPASEDIENLIGTGLYNVWNSLCQAHREELRNGATLEPWRQSVDV